MYPYYISVTSPTEAIAYLNIPMNQSSGLYDTYVSNYFDGTIMNPLSFEVQNWVNSPVINADNSSEINIYPNPFHSYAIINLPNHLSEKTILYIHDISGKIILTDDNFSGENYILQRGNLKNGIYFIELAGNKKYWKKIIVE